MDSQSLKIIPMTVKVFDFLDYRHYLQAVYCEIQQQSESYSYLQLAEDFGFSKTNVLHLIIRGKRPLTLKSADRIVSTLGLKGHEKRYFNLMVTHQNSRKPAEREQSFQEMMQLKSKSLTSAASKAQLDFFSEWYHIVIYELCSMPAFKSDARWIAAHTRPQIRADEARKSLKLLETLDLIRFDESLNRHVPTKTRVSTGDEIASVAVTRYHHKMIDLGKRSITDIEDQDRDVSAVAMAIPKNRIEAYKALVSRFRKEVLSLADSEKAAKDSVYQLNIQLFPVTQKLEDTDSDDS